MKVGDLVELKDSVLHGSADLDMADRMGTSPPKKERWIGVITEKHLNALKVHWFNKDGTTRKPSTSQYVLKVKVISEL